MDGLLNENNMGETYSEEYRFNCEVLSVVRMYKTKGSEFVKDFFLKVEKHRGTESAQRLRNEALKIVQTGKKNEKPRRY